MTASAAFARAKLTAGGSHSLAIALTYFGLPITRHGIRSWAMVPARYLDAVSAITGIPARELRPDLHQAKGRAA